VATVTIIGDLTAPSRWRQAGFARIPCRVFPTLLLGLLSSLCSAQSAPTESQVKAAYLYNFGKFVTWPNDGPASAERFQICILGKDPFGSVLDSTVNGESIDRKKIQIRRFDKMQDAAGCNVLYVSSSEESRLPAILAESQRLRLLTVSDILHFAERGGAIGLVTQQDRVRFEVNRSTAERSHLVLSSELLKVAIRVIQKQDGS
jgi:hypothetical protein